MWLKKHFIYLVAGLFTSFISLSAQSLSEEESKLYDLIMEYRESLGLEVVPLSPALNRVARMHVQDLIEHPPKGRCNLHSWSNYGEWSSCCYNGSPKSFACMWDKPRELTTYTGNGYEIAYWSSADASADEALTGWKKSKGHNTVIINRGVWRDVQWKAIGIAIRGEYAVVWFGKELDL